MDNKIWDTRKLALSALESRLQTEAESIYKTFSMMDEMLNIFHQNSTDSTFCDVAGLTLLKARNLTLGILSLTLDGLGQEAGALLRPLLECSELLEYFSKDPQRVNEALEDKLPAAGEIAKIIQGKFQPLRNHLNTNASHFSLSTHSINHLIDFKTGDWKVVQPFNEDTLQTNVSNLCLIAVHLMFEAANCLAYDGLLSNSLEDRIKALKERVLTISGYVPPE